MKLFVLLIVILLPLTKHIVLYDGYFVSRVRPSMGKTAPTTARKEEKAISTVSTVLVMKVPGTIVHHQLR